MRAIRSFTIRASLPESLAPLRDLVLNLRWSWHSETRELFAGLDPAGRENAGSDPVTLLGEIPPEYLRGLASDEEYLRAVIPLLKKAKVSALLLPGIGTVDHLRMAKDCGVSTIRVYEGEIAGQNLFVVMTTTAREDVLAQAVITVGIQ